MFGKADEPECPWFRAPCKKHGCVMWTHIEGTNPQNGQPVDVWNCSVKLLPMLLIEASSQVRGVQAATESFRNEMVRNGQAMQSAHQTLAEIADQNVKAITDGNSDST